MIPDLEIERYHGNTLVIPVGLTTDEHEAVSLEGAQIRFKLGEISDLSTGYLITRDDSAGNFCIIITAPLMATLTNPIYYFATEITYASGFRETLFVGKLTLKDNLIP